MMVDCADSFRLSRRDERIRRTTPARSDTTM
jgi:hypothetical protein